MGQKSCKKMINPRSFWRPSKFRCILYKIHQQLTDGDLEDVKYLCLDIIAERKQERIKNGIQLLKQLEKIGVIDSGNVKPLAELLKKIGRADLERILNEYQEMQDKKSDADMIKESKSPVDLVCCNRFVITDEECICGRRAVGQVGCSKVVCPSCGTERQH